MIEGFLDFALHHFLKFSGRSNHSITNWAYNHSAVPYNDQANRSTVNEAINRFASIFAEHEDESNTPIDVPNLSHASYTFQDTLNPNENCSSISVDAFSDALLGIFSSWVEGYILLVVASAGIMLNFVGLFFILQNFTCINILLKKTKKSKQN